jgi:hypothetical protein
MFLLLLLIRHTKSRTSCQKQLIFSELIMSSKQARDLIHERKLSLLQVGKIILHGSSFHTDFAHSCCNRMQFMKRLKARMKVAGSCEHGNEISGSIKGEEFLG